MKTFFLSLFTVSSFLPFFLSAQSLDWKTRISGKAEPTTNNPSAEFKTTAVGPDGRIYSSGYFHGFHAHIGNTILKADSAGFVDYYSDTNFFGPPPIPTSLFVACHESNGTLVWAKAITSAPAYDISSFLLWAWPSVSGDKIVFDDQGNLVMAGVYMGDTLKYDGVPFENNAPELVKFKVVITKISPSGSLIWGRSERPLSNFNNPRVKSLQILNGNIEAMVFRPDSVVHYTIFRYTGNGTRLPALNYQPQFAGGNSSWLTSHCSLPDGRYLFCSYSSIMDGGNGTSIFSVLNPDFSAVSHHKISVYIPGQPGNPTSGSGFPSSIGTLPDGQISVLLMVINNLTITSDWKLIIDTDTLDIPIQTNTQTLMIRMSEPGCMKKVEMLDFSNFGENDLSPNGNWVILKGNDNLNFGVDTLPEIKMVDRNGSVIQSLPLGNLGASPSLYAENALNTVHHLQWTNGGVIGCYGSWLFKASLPDPVVADQSFSGCLSNRSLLLANEETLHPDPVACVYESQPGNWEIQGLPANGARYQLMSAQGQTLLSGSTTSVTARFKTASLPVGMYYLHINDEKGLSRTLRVVSSY
ncbi:MAG TPA: hypothetical protein PLK63_13445 [Catalimonadaceae bacterium]|nr:hypothetical protein [Catalimonadaceae bacterium]